MKSNESEPKSKPKPNTKSDRAPAKAAAAKPKERPRKKLVPQRLPEKLAQIRSNSNLSQGKMLCIVNPTEKDEGNRARISQYEKGNRAPSIVEFFNYSLFARIPMETLADDALDLPQTLKLSAGDDEEQLISAADGLTVRISEDTFKQYRAVYLELLGEMSFEAMSRLSPTELLEQMLAVAINDYRLRGSRSALAKRVRQLIEEKE